MISLHLQHSRLPFCLSPRKAALIHQLSTWLHDLLKCKAKEGVRLQQNNVRDSKMDKIQDENRLALVVRSENQMKSLENWKPDEISGKLALNRRG